MWTFGRKIAAGFALAFLLLTIIGAVAYRSINSLTATSRSVTHTHEVLEHIAVSEATSLPAMNLFWNRTGTRPWLSPSLSTNFVR